MEAAAIRGIRFDERGLAPCVVQDWRTGEVLMLAWVNAEAVERSQATGEMHFFSRSRGRLWRKGEESGATQRVRQLRYDCDGDAVLALVEPAGPACHTGERSCFYREVGGSADPAVDAPPAPGEPQAVPFEALGRLERVVAARDRDRPSGSYTAALLADPSRIGAKVGEEAEEVVRAAASESADRVAEESADLIYHLAVLSRSRGLDLAAALEVLNGRRDG
jgi:phosphoribosyl-AMP cyclohydrolase / phosphoribosyl-ATP pyrophosphohydrolase